MEAHEAAHRQPCSETSSVCIIRHAWLVISSDPLVRNTIDLVSGDQLGEPPRLSLGRMTLPTCTRPNLSYGGVWGSTRLLAPATVNAAGALSRGARWSVPPAP